MNCAYSGEKIDVWAAGVILYTFFTREPPFFSSDPMELRDMILNARFTPPDGISEGDFPPACFGQCLFFLQSYACVSMLAPLSSSAGWSFFMAEILTWLCSVFMWHEECNVCAGWHVKCHLTPAFSCVCDCGGGGGGGGGGYLPFGFSNRGARFVEGYALCGSGETPVQSCSCGTSLDGWPPETSHLGAVICTLLSKAESSSFSPGFLRFLFILVPENISLSFDFVSAGVADEGYPAIGSSRGPGRG